VPPTPVRLTRRALEGGPAQPSSAFPVTTQGYAVTSGRRERSSPSLSALCGYPRHCSATPALRRHTRRCWSARGRDVAMPTTVPRTDPPVDGTLESARGGGRTTNHYATTLEAAPVRAQDAPRRPDLSRLHQDGRQLCSTARHASTRRRTVRHVCKLLPPWPIKGEAVPQPQGGTTDSNHIHALRLHHDIGTCLNQYLWYLEARSRLPSHL
jgi:hypothetical protein